MVLVSRPAAMAQLKAAGDPGRSPQDGAEVFSDMATVTSSAGESGDQCFMQKSQCDVRCFNYSSGFDAPVIVLLKKKFN